VIVPPKEKNMMTRRTTRKNMAKMVTKIKMGRIIKSTMITRNIKMMTKKAQAMAKEIRVRKLQRKIRWKELLMQWKLRCAQIWQKKSEGKI